MPSPTESAEPSTKLGLDRAIPAVRSIAAEDPVRELPSSALAALAAVYGITAADDLLEFPDDRILFAVRHISGAGEHVLAATRAWLQRQRQARGELINPGLEARAIVHTNLLQARKRIASAVRVRMHEAHITRGELARLCRTNITTVDAMVDDTALPSLELALRMAVSLGLKVRIDVVG